jgi:DNA-directed RNA polymerase subunit RPC12/RpoP
MTLDEAIKHCEEVAETKRQDAEDAEINGCDNFARNCEECASEHRQLAEWLKELKKFREQQSEDAISRQAALDIYDDYNVAVENGELEAYRKHRKRLLKLPPVQPKTGHWIKITPSGIYMCSECEQNVLTGDIDVYHYCHHCGIKMINVPDINDGKMSETLTGSESEDKE